MISEWMNKELLYVLNTMPLGVILLLHYVLTVKFDFTLCPWPNWPLIFGQQRRLELDSILWNRS